MIRAVLSGFAALLLATSPAAAAPEVGKAAPEFSLKNSKGADVKLSDFKGKTVVLEWHNPECPFVKKHYDSGNMQKLQGVVKDMQVVWLTINSSAAGKQGNMDGAKADAYIASSKSAQSYYLLDADGTVGKLYEAKTTPHMFVINPEGNIAYMGAIDDKPSADKADIAGAKNYVYAAIMSIAQKKPVETSTTQPYGCNVKYAD